jgi:hypothetical protein
MAESATDIRDPDMVAEDPMEVITPVRREASQAVEKLEVPKMAPERTIATEDVPQPFRPSSLRSLIEKYAKANKIKRDDPQLKPFRFLRDHGLPSPKVRIRMQGYVPIKGNEERRWPALELECDDAADCIRLYNAASGIPDSEVHKIKYRHVVVEN